MLIGSEVKCGVPCRWHKLEACHTGAAAENINSNVHALVHDHDQQHSLKKTSPAWKTFKNTSVLSDLKLLFTCRCKTKQRDRWCFQNYPHLLSSARTWQSVSWLYTSVESAAAQSRHPSISLFPCGVQAPDTLTIIQYHIISVQWIFNFNSLTCLCW